MTEETKIILGRLDEMNQRFDRVDESFVKVDERLNKVDERLDKVDERLDKMDERFDKVDERLDKMDERFDKMDERMDRMDNNITEIRLTLDNETNRNIRIVAEGHLDLSRKLDRALSNANEREMLLIRVNRLENEVDKINRRISQGA